jgi:hypothetical protein
MTVPDEEVFAFVDGELPPEAMARIEAAMTTDPQLALRVETQRSLRRLLSGAHAGAARQAAAPTAAAPTPPASKPAEVIAFPGAKAKDRAKAKTKDAAKPREPKLPGSQTGRGASTWIGLAACLVIGLVVGRLAAPSPATLSGVDDPAPLAVGPLAQALNGQASGQGAGPVRISLSFRTASGVYCRAFQASSRSPQAGVACREADGWRVRAVSPAVDTRGTQAPAPVLAVVNTMIAGPPLDAAGEAKAMAAGWKPSRAAP